MTDILEKTLPSAVLRAENLPSIPGVAVQVLRLTQDEDATLDDLARVLSMDPALAAKLLKLSNSSLFSLGAEITTLQRACMVLGLKTVKLMSLSFSLASSLSSGEASGVFDHDSYWHRSVVAAVAGRSLARAFGHHMEDEAFLCGLLSRIGQFVIGVCLPEEYAQVVGTSARWVSFAEEEAKLGFNGQDVSGALLRSWDLPELISTTVAALHDPERLPPDVQAETRELVQIMHVAAHCEELICGDDRGAAKLALDRVAADSYRLTSAEVDEFLVGLEEQIRDTAEMLDIELEGALGMHDVLAQAQAQLIKLSLGVATEMKQVEQKATLLETRNRELRSQAHTDRLTGLANRASFDEILCQCVQERLHTRVPQSLGLLMIDVDRFKSFNDTYGHQVGDEVLRLVGEVLSKVTRESDVPARYGGEEFSVILPRTTSIGMKSLAERVRNAIGAARIDADGRTLSVTASIGGVCVGEVPRTRGPEALVKIADHYLYKAKQGGRNRCEFFPHDKLPD